MCQNPEAVLTVPLLSSRAGKDDQVTIVDFCKMAIDPEPADLALEMRAVKFILDYDGAKKAEYERLRRAESRMEKNVWRSGLRRAAKSKELADGVEPDEPPSQDEIDVSNLYCTRSTFTHSMILVPPFQPSLPHQVGF